MRTLATVGKQIPNTTTLASLNAKNPQLAAFANASKFSWFVPTAPNWVKVENARVLKNLFQAIITGRKSVANAAKDASNQITKILNQPVT
jgi:N,N'-diacetylchitobiose transport system substrate-binding protein